MGIAEQFSRTMHEQLGAYGAWLPVANSYALGDYGLVSDGRFTQVGNIGTLGVEFDEKGSRKASLSFTSQGTRLIKAGADASLQATAEAKLRIEFGSKDSLVVRADNITVTEIAELGQVAKLVHNSDDWHLRYRIVFSLWNAHNATVAIANADNAALELSGSADALELVEAGKAKGGVTVASERDVGFHSIGKDGVIALGLFRLKLFTGRPKVLADGTAAIEVDESDELPDDL